MPDIRYKTIEKDGKTIILKDDGYRIRALIVPEDSEAWILWAEYKHCNLPFIGFAVADILMEEK